MNYVCHGTKRKTKKPKQKKIKKSFFCDDDCVRHQVWSPANVPLVLGPEFTKQNQDEYSDRLPYAFVLPYSFAHSNTSTTDERWLMCVNLWANKTCSHNQNQWNRCMEYGCVVQNEKDIERTHNFRQSMIILCARASIPYVRGVVFIAVYSSACNHIATHSK